MRHTSYAYPSFRSLALQLKIGSWLGLSWHREAVLRNTHLAPIELAFTGWCDG
jgi:hypothetical protein